MNCVEVKCYNHFMPEKILIVEDELVLQETLKYNFSNSGYDVKTAGDGTEGLKIARDWSPDLILLDVMLPGMDGFEVCKTLRAETDIPILMLTARSEEIDRVVGFEIGADDYIVKPFSMRELIARVRTRLKVYGRIHSKEGENKEIDSIQEIVAGNLVIDRKRHEIRVDNSVVPLKPKEMDLLCYLVENRGRALSREIILNQVWGWDYIGGSRTVDVHIRWLRSKIESDPAHPTRLVTVPGIGYRFEG
jgi:DNA-binding response OmpR family regulator